MSSTRHPGFPARPLLRPGSRVCRRGDGRLQVGLADHLAVTAPDTESVRALLDDLRDGTAPGPISTLDPDQLRLCAELLDRGLFLDADTLLHTLGNTSAPEMRESLSAFCCEHGDRAPAVLIDRAAAPVLLTDADLPGPAARLTELLSGAGVVLHGPPALAVHLARGEPDRELIDEWVRDDLPHVLLNVCEGIVSVGPFVVPGSTACLRCLDAHRAEADPRRPLVVAQYVGSRTPRDGIPEPIPHDLLEMALLWLSRDVVAWLDGEEPTTWSTTVLLDPALELPRTRWRQHVACGCGWGRVVGL